MASGVIDTDVVCLDLFYNIGSVFVCGIVVVLVRLVNVGYKTPKADGWSRQEKLRDKNGFQHDEERRSTTALY